MDNQARKVTMVGLWTNLGLIALKLTGGLWVGSRALVADAAHSFSDVVTDLAVLLGLKLGGLPADTGHPFGHRRMETLVSVLVGVVLVGAGAGLGWDAYLAVIHPEPGDGSWLAPVVALLSVLSKEALYRYTMAVGKKTGSPALKANAWHHRSDALSSACVLLGSGVAALNPAWHLADPLAALVVSALVALAGVKVIREGIDELIDRAPDNNVLGAMEKCVLSVAGVEGVHDMRVRSLGGRYCMDLHVVVDGDLTIRQGHAISDEVEACLRAEVPRVELVTVHLDPDQK